MNEISSYLKEIRQATRHARVQQLNKKQSPSSGDAEAAVAVLVRTENALRKATVKTLPALERTLHLLADSTKELAHLIAHDFQTENARYQALRLLIATYLGAIPVLMLHYRGRCARKVHSLGWEIESMLSNAGLQARIACNRELLDGICSRLDTNAFPRRPHPVGGKAA